MKMTTQKVEKRYKTFINGEQIEGVERNYFPVLNPATEEIIAEVPLCTEVDVNRAVEAAEEAFKTWKKTTPSERSILLLKWADLIEQNSEHLARLESLNVGKPIAYAKADIEFVIDQIRFFAGAARNLQGLSMGEYVPNHSSMIRREPIGVTASIAPWNYPLVTAATLFAPALAAGNTVVLKPSELTPLTALIVADLSRDIFPSGVFNVVTGYGNSVGAALSKHPKVKMISLIGSVRSGMEVAREAVNTLKKVHLELGGKAPVLIFDDADLSEVIEGMKMAGFVNSGQDCTAATRLYVSEKIYNQFVDQLVSAVETIKLGDPQESDTEMGPLVSKAHLDRVAGFIDRAKNNPNVKILTGGKAINCPGYFFEPTVITGVKQTDEIVQEEVFGPVITVIPFSSYEEAIEMANDCKYALAASVWTKNIDRAMKATKDLEFGTVWTNTHLTITSEMPHGGSKLSGYGKDQSIYSLEEYTEIKHVMIKVQ